MQLTHQDISQDLPATVQVSNPVIALSRNLFTRRHQQMRRREQGMMMRLASEIGLSNGTAGHYESHIQGKIPHSFSGYGRSAATMS
jgi:hypothetical protein